MKRLLFAGLPMLCALAAAAQPKPDPDRLRTDIPPLAEIDPLDPPEAVVRRFAFTARGVMAQEFAIPNSHNMFCRLSNQYNLELNYYPSSDEWIFQVQSVPEAQLAAGGIAICLDWKRAAAQAGAQ
jgi:hypothetical protein